MKEGLTYTAPDGQTHKVLMYDEINKMVYINLFGTRHRWVHEDEYSTWVVNDTAQMPKIHIPDMPSQMTEEQAKSVNYDLETDELKPEQESVSEEPKKKRVYKKKV